MPGWLGIAGTVALIVALAILGGVFGRRIGRMTRTGVGLGLIMLGVGHVVDAPPAQAIEVVDDERDDSEAPSGDPDET